MKRAAFTLVALVATAVIVACSSSTADTPADPAGSCAALASQCHSYSKESAFAKECHDLGHAGDDVACAPKKDACLAACPPREGGTTHPDTDAGDAAAPTVDAATDAAPDAAVDQLCIDHCACLAETCTTFAGYPFAAPGSCAAACAQLGAPERACLPHWCVDAKASTSTKAHLCEHAWNMYGLDECP